MSKLTQCPHCSSTAGYYRKTRISGWGRTYYDLGGKLADNHGLHDGLKYIEQKTMYCADCNTAIGRADS